MHGAAGAQKRLGAGDGGTGTPQPGALSAAFSASRAAAPAGEEKRLGKEKRCCLF